MIMTDEKLIKAIKIAREGSKKRNFRQSFDIAINLKNIDVKKPEGKVKVEVSLPNAAGKAAKIGFFADALIPQAKKYPEDILLIRKEDLEAYGRDKKAAKAVASSCATFIAEAPLMPMVGKLMGQVLATRGKMPKPVPPNIPDIKPVIERAKSSVKLSVKDSPALHCRVGDEGMIDEKVAENCATVISAIEAALPKGREQIKNIYIKLTMGKPAKLEP
jgi:large subunit ribosomal protein L1